MNTHALLRYLRFPPLPLCPPRLCSPPLLAVPFLVLSLPAYSLLSRIRSRPRYPFPPLRAVHPSMYPVVPFKPGQVVVFFDVAVVASHRTRTLCVSQFSSNYSRNSVLAILLSEYWDYLVIEVDLFENEAGLW